MNPAPVMVHPSMSQPYPAMTPSIPNPMAFVAPSPPEVFIVIVSKHSPSCTKIFDTVKFLMPHLQIQILEIDNPDIRKLVLQSGKIKTVPTIALMYPQQNKVDFYEGTSALQLLQQRVEEVQQKIQRLAAASVPPAQRATDIAQVLDVAPSRPVAPQQAPPMMMQPPQHPPMRMQGPPQAPIVQGEFADPNDMRANPLERNIATMSPMSPISHEEAEMGGNPAEIMGGTFIDDSIYDVDTSNAPPQGMSREEIMGGDQAIINRERDKKSKANQGKMEAMMREREEMDKRTLDPRMARRP